MNNLNLDEIVSATSLLVVFSTLLFTYFVTTADKLIYYKLSQIITDRVKLKNKKDELKNFIIKWLFSITFLNLLICAVIFPSTLKIIANKQVFNYKF